MSYAGQDGTPKPFLVIVEWIKVAKEWKIASEIILPVPPTARCIGEVWPIVAWQEFDGYSLRRRSRLYAGLASQRDRLVGAILQDFVRQLAVVDGTGELQCADYQPVDRNRLAPPLGSRGPRAERPRSIR